jgi:hypothetical protein
MVPRPPIPIATDVLVPILVGQGVIGHVLSRGPVGWESFNANDVTLGVFRDEARAISRLLSTVASSAP